ncbi:hypothetical protein DRO02_02695 [archaeon]|nr:MAG: hypothetical protein DRO02_02695 [archaeon]RLG65317.1 MAG: hypothetical protein DRO21_02230 [archaeon]RLG66832.1 MAG: hypothetical protein DRN89_00010 [archaeon]HDM23860.1 FAD synthase [Candidatus Bathyarchaeota archaeon]
MKKAKVLVGGTFDIIHPGHVFLLKEASKYGDVIVVVARDSTVKRIKGRSPVFDERHRLLLVNSIKYVKKAILGKESNDILEIVEELKPDIIVLGPDQKLEDAISKRFPHIKVIKLDRKIDFGGLYSSSDVIKKILKIYTAKEL